MIWRRATLAVTLHAFLVTEAALAGVNRWTSNGPDGGFVSSLAIDPENTSILYAGTSGGGIHKSTDGGANWSQANVGLTSLEINNLTINPSDSDVLYAGTEGGGIFKSVDGGLSWRAASDGLSDANALYVQTIVANPMNPNTLYAATLSGIFKSSNGGAGWDLANGGMNSDIAAILIVNPQTPTTLYAAGSRLYKSVDAGKTWTLLPNTPEGVLALAIDHANPSTLYIGSLDKGVFKSVDGGATWVAINNGLGSFAILNLAVPPGNSQVLYASSYSALFKSLDEGATWSFVDSGLADISCITLDPLDPALLYVGADGVGISKSVDGGASWTTMSTGLRNSTVWSLIVDPQDASTLYASVRGLGVLKTSDRGQSWHSANNSLPGAIRSFAIASDPPAVFAGGHLGVYKSTDGGQGWSPVISGLTNTDVRALAIDPANPEVVYAGTAGGGMFKSINAGQNWSPINNGLSNLFVEALGIDPLDSSRLYVGTLAGLFMSSNRGDTWVWVSQLSSVLVYSLAITPSNPLILYVGTAGDGIFKSTDGGASWVAQSSGLPVPVVWALAVDPLRPSIIYAGLPTGVATSYDGGANWGFFKGGEGWAVRALAVTRESPAFVFAGTEKAGMREIAEHIGFFTITPCRAFDTRNAEAGETSLTSGEIRIFHLGGACGVPPFARSVSVNATALNPTHLGHVTLFPGDEQTSTSTINFGRGQTRANNTIISLSRDGQGTLGVSAFVFGGGKVDLLIDVNGYFE